MKRKFDAFEIFMGLVVVGALMAVVFMSGKSDSGVVLLDVQRAFRDLGRDIMHIQEMKKQQGAMEKKIFDLRTELEGNLAAKVKEFGNSPTDEQQKELSRIEQELAQRIGVETAKINRELGMIGNQMQMQFYQEIKPMAEQIAAKRGAKIVVNSNVERIIAFDFSVDITDDVVQAMQQASQSPSVEGTDNAGQE